MRRNHRICLFLCLLLTSILLIGCQGSGNCEPPEEYFPYDILLHEDTAYFSANGKMYTHHPGDRKPTEVADFRGTYWDTSTGLYAVNDQTKEVFTVDSDTLTPLTTIEPDGLYRLLGVHENGLYWTTLHGVDPGTDGTHVYRTDLATGERTTVFSFPNADNYDSKLPGRLADGKIWFTDSVSFLYYDLTTNETVTYCTSFWPQHAEPWWEPIYYEDFMLCKVIQYAEDGATTLGHPYYRLDYGASAPTHLTDHASLSGIPSLLNGTLYYMDNVEGTRCLLACNANTGQTEILLQEDWRPEEFAITGQGAYYSQDNDLYYYDLETEKSVKLIDKGD